MYLRSAAWPAYFYIRQNTRHATLRNIKTLYSGLSKSNFKDHYGDNYLENSVWVGLPK